MLKEGLKKDVRSSFLFRYQITPQTTTGLAPTKMLLGCKSKFYLDLLHPDGEKKLRVQQRKQKTCNDRHVREQSF